MYVSCLDLTRYSRYNFGRICDIKVLEEPFTIKGTFDIKKYLQSSFGIYKGKKIRAVTLRFSPVKSKWVRSQIWHKDQKVRFLKNGSLELSFPVASYAEITMEVLKRGSEVEVIKPQSLRELIKSEAKKNKNLLNSNPQKT